MSARSGVRHWSRRDDGAATVFGVALMGVLLAFAMACCAIGSLVVTHRRAEAAADLAALAGAQAVQSGADGCAAADRIAVANGAELRSCAVAGFDVLVSVGVAAAPVFGAGLSLPARARAGPQRAARSVGEQRVEQGDRADLVQRVVLVAALG